MFLNYKKSNLKKDNFIFIFIKNNQINKMLKYTELKPGVNFTKDGQPYTVLDYTHVKKQRGAPIVQLKIRNLITGKTKDVTAHQNEEFKEADIKRIPAEFIYYQDHKDEYWFKNPDDPSERTPLSTKIVGEAKKYLKPGLEIKMIQFKEDIVDIEIPIKIDFKVKTAPPNVEGNTADSGDKRVTIETGYKVSTPLFIEKGDIIKVNTETGEYVERVEKK
jgi:elongation factor P